MYKYIHRHIPTYVHSSYIHKSLQNSHAYAYTHTLKHM